MTQDSPHSVAIIGLGNIGCDMATNLPARGYNVYPHVIDAKSIFIDKKVL